MTANWSREDIIVMIIFASIGLIIPGVVALRHFLGLDPLYLLHMNRGRTFFGVIFTVLATGTCLLNVYLTLLLPWLYRRRHGGMRDFAGVSGLPVIGGFFVLFAGVLMPPSVLLGIYLLLLYALDGNGIPLFFVSVLRNGT